jgi:hypothetical protein
VAANTPECDRQPAGSVESHRITSRVSCFIYLVSRKVAVKEQVTRVLLERLIVNRPPSMGTAHHLHRASSRIKGSGHLILLSLRQQKSRRYSRVARSCMLPRVRSVQRLWGARSSDRGIKIGITQRACRLLFIYIITSRSHTINIYIHNSNTFHCLIC